MSSISTLAAPSAASPPIEVTTYAPAAWRRTSSSRVTAWRGANTRSIGTPRCTSHSAATAPSRPLLPCPTSTTTRSPGLSSLETSWATACPARSCSAASLIPAANAAASSARIWATETIFTLHGRGNGWLCWLRRRAHLRPRARSTIVRAHGIGDAAWLGALGHFDRLDHDVRRRQRARFFGQSATECFHEPVVDLLAAVLGQQLTHLENVVFIPPTLIGPLLHPFPPPGPPVRPPPPRP